MAYQLPAGINTFKDFAAFYKERVYGKICEYLPTGEPKYFNENILRSYVDRKGQYRRPSYLLLWNLLYGGDENEAILPAAVQQVSEDWILMHDDIYDSNELRRGKPSAHILFGVNYTIIAGDALHTVMWKMINDARASLGDRGKKYFDMIYNMLLTTQFGQYYDTRLTSEIKEIDKFTLDEYYQSIYVKAAYYTVYGPMQAGVIIAGADDSVLDQIFRYGTPAGKAFQIKDDILDCTATEKELGKTVGNDVLEGTKTLILWHAANNAPTEVLNKLKAIYNKPRSGKTQEDVKFVLETFKELGSIDYAQKEADRLTDEAIKTFAESTKNIPDSPLKSLALDAIGNTSKRTK